LSHGKASLGDHKQGQDTHDDEGKGEAKPKERDDTASAGVFGTENPALQVVPDNE